MVDELLAHLEPLLSVKRVEPRRELVLLRRTAQRHPVYACEPREGGRDGLTGRSSPGQARPRRSGSTRPPPSPPPRSSSSPSSARFCPGGGCSAGARAVPRAVGGQMRGRSTVRRVSARAHTCLLAMSWWGHSSAAGRLGVGVVRMCLQWA